MKVIHVGGDVGGESARRYIWIFPQAWAVAERHRGYFGYSAVRACSPYANCRDGRQICVATGTTGSRQQKLAVFIRRENPRRPLSLSFQREEWTRATACRFCRDPRS